MEKLLKKHTNYQWNDEFHESLDILKENMVNALILVFIEWEKGFHMHVDASVISLGVTLTKLGEGDIDHPFAFLVIHLSYFNITIKLHKGKD